MLLRSYVPTNSAFNLQTIMKEKERLPYLVLVALPPKA